MFSRLTLESELPMLDLAFRRSVKLRLHFAFLSKIQVPCRVMRVLLLAAFAVVGCGSVGMRC
jgi:hypothetical protein